MLARVVFTFSGVGFEDVGDVAWYFGYDGAGMWTRQHVRELAPGETDAFLSGLSVIDSFSHITRVLPLRSVVYGSHNGDSALRR